MPTPFGTTFSENVQRPSTIIYLLARVVSRNPAKNSPYSFEHLSRWCYVERAQRWTTTSKSCCKKWPNGTLGKCFEGVNDKIFRTPSCSNPRYVRGHLKVWSTLQTGYNGKSDNKKCSRVIKILVFQALWRAFKLNLKLLQFYNLRGGCCSWCSTLLETVINFRFFLPHSMERYQQLVPVPGHGRPVRLQRAGRAASVVANAECDVFVSILWSLLCSTPFGNKSLKLIKFVFLIIYGQVIKCNWNALFRKWIPNEATNLIKQNCYIVWSWFNITIQFSWNKFNHLIGSIK